MKTITLLFLVFLSACGMKQFERIQDDIERREDLSSVQWGQIDRLINQGYDEESALTLVDLAALNYRNPSVCDEAGAVDVSLAPRFSDCFSFACLRGNNQELALSLLQPRCQSLETNGSDLSVSFTCYPLATGIVNCYGVTRALPGLQYYISEYLDAGIRNVFRGYGEYFEDCVTNTSLDQVVNELRRDILTTASRTAFFNGITIRRSMRCMGTQVPGYDASRGSLVYQLSQSSNSYQIQTGRVSVANQNIINQILRARFHQFKMQSQGNAIFSASSDGRRYCRFATTGNNSYNRITGRAASTVTATIPNIRSNSSFIFTGTCQANSNSGSNNNTNGNSNNTGGNTGSTQPNTGGGTGGAQPTTLSAQDRQIMTQMHNRSIFRIQTIPGQYFRSYNDPIRTGFRICSYGNLHHTRQATGLTGYEIDRRTAVIIPRKPNAIRYVGRCPNNASN